LTETASDMPQGKFQKSKLKNKTVNKKVSYKSGSFGTSSLPESSTPECIGHKIKVMLTFIDDSSIKTFKVSQDRSMTDDPVID